MRLWIALIILLGTTPVYAQSMSVGTSSGATAAINMSDPPAASTTTRVISAPTIAAPGLAAAGVETCLGSASGGLSVMGGGFSFGGTKVDEGCTIRLLARQLFSFGLKNAALALMCQDPHVILAMQASGTPCPPPSSPPMQISEQLPAASDDHSTAVTADVGTTVPVAALQGGYILDLPHAAIHPRTHLSLAAPPYSQAEQAWFDHASDIN